MHLNDIFAFKYPIAASLVQMYLITKREQTRTSHQMRQKRLHAQ